MPRRETASSGAHEITPLRRAAASGVRWVFAGAVVAGVMQVAQLAVLARVLDHAELGQVGVLIAIITVGRVVVDFGLSGASIARQTTDPVTLTSLFWANTAIGAVTGIVLLALGTPLGSFLSISALPEYLPWIAGGLLLGGAAQQSRAYLQRDLRFRGLATIESVGSVVGGIVTISAAIAGAGVVSLAVGFLCAAAVQLALLLASHWASWRPRLAIHPRKLRGHASFGAYFTGSRVVTELSANLDYVMISYFLGPAALGPYTLAYEMTVKPYQRLNPVITRVAFPIYAKRQSDNASLRRGFLETTRLIAFFVVPIVAAMAVLAPNLVPTLFGSGWEQTVDLLPIVAIVGVLRALGNPSGSVYLAKQRPDIGFKFGLFTLVTSALIFALAAQQSVTAVAAAYAALMMLYFLINRAILRRIIGLSLVQYLRTVTASLALSAGAVLAVLIVEAMLGAGALGSPAVRLALLGAVFVLAFVVLTATFQRRYLAYVWRLAKPGNRKRAAVA